MRVLLGDSRHRVVKWIHYSIRIYSINKIGGGTLKVSRAIGYVIATLWPPLESS